MITLLEDNISSFITTATLVIAGKAWISPAIESLMVI
jgi:hypothetical protein